MTWKWTDDLRDQLLNWTHSNSQLVAAMDTHGNVSKCVQADAAFGAGYRGVRAMLDKLRSEHSKRAAYHVLEEDLNNAERIAARVAAVPPETQSALRTTLSYLYLLNGPLNLRNPTFRIAEGYLTPCEVILARYLKSRTGGVGRKVYGKEALFQMRQAGYKCECCGNGDVRTLHLDHVHGRAQKVFFVLCANCHNIKSRLFDWSGAKKLVDGA